MTRMTEEEKQTIIQLAIDGYAVKEIITMVGRSQCAVQKILKDNGITPVKKYPQKPPKLTEKRKVIIDLRKEGHSYRDIAKQLGVNRHYVLEVSKLFGLDGVRAKTLVHEDPNEYIQKYYPNLEYVSGWTSCEGRAVISCMDCGCKFEYSMKSLRSHLEQIIICPECRKHEVEKQKILKAKARIEERNRKLKQKEEQKQERFWSQTFEQKTWKTCPVCGGIFVGRGTYCSEHCRMQLKDKQKNEYRYQIPLDKLYERDNGICYLCGKPCNWDDYYTNKDGIIVYGNDYPSRDHVKAKSKGGENSWGNIRLAHRICNAKKWANDILPVEN